MLMFTAFPSQQTAAARSAPRSSTPTKSGAFISNGVHDVTSAVNGSQFKAPANPSLPSGAVAMPTNVNGAGAAGKTGSGSGGLSGSGGGESVPRGQPATPSMIEGWVVAGGSDSAVCTGVFCLHSLVMMFTRIIVHMFRCSLHFCAVKMHIFVGKFLRAVYKFVFIRSFKALLKLKQKWCNRKEKKGMGWGWVLSRMFVSTETWRGRFQWKRGCVSSGFHCYSCNINKQSCWSGMCLIRVSLLQL